MASLNKDLNRLINGVTLVAKEFVKRSPALDSVKSGGELQSLISYSLKNALVSATDIAGLTKGNVREFSVPTSTSSRYTATDSVVYFNGPPDQASSETRNSEALDTIASNANEITDADHYAEKNLREVRSGDAVGEAFSDRHESITDGLDGLIGGKAEDHSSARNAVSGEAEASGERTKSPQLKRRKPRERRVPSTPFSRALGFAALGGGLAMGTLQESAKRLVFGKPSSPDNQSALSPFLSERNAERIALALCRMRGAALKVGQMLSIQDESLVPAPILAALDIVRQGADVMPRSQVNKVLDAELGPEWTSKLTSFDYEPLAAASIGQVHRAVTKDGMKVAMKIQYPGVADSIDSDIRNVKLLLDYTNLIPEGLYLDRAIKVAREELARECDYELEAASEKRFRDLLSGTEGFYVPIVVDEISSKRVLTTELVLGIPIDKVAQLDQETRNYVGTKLLELTLKELFVFRFMQTDPNWSNFLFDETTKTINLIDFGAARDYPKSFVDNYLRMVLACSNGDRDGVIEMSKRLGFITGEESEIMLDAHVQSGFIVGLPFAKPGGYDFSHTYIIKNITSLGATMLKHRLTPPPDEAYSLHRKLSGAFLACIKLGSVVPCKKLLLEVYERYQFDEESQVLASSSMSS